jgi:hypothetical protein
MVVGSVETLRGLGFDVYPGDVGLVGIHTMADLLALDGDKPLFVECLTSSAISEHRAHLKKMPLASAVPFCFVGKLPEKFVSALPSNAFAVDSPSALRIHFEKASLAANGSGGLAVRGKRKDLRKRSLIELSVTGMREGSDTVGHLRRLLWRHGYRLLHESPSWCVDGRALQHAFHIWNEESALAIRYWETPLVAELRGPDAALLLLRDCLVAEGVRFEVTPAVEGQRVDQASRR